MTTPEHAHSDPRVEILAAELLEAESRYARDEFDWSQPWDHYRQWAVELLAKLDAAGRTS